MEAADTKVEAAALGALAKLADVLESIGPQEEAELPAQLLAEFVMVCSRTPRKKDKLLCSQLQVVDFLQNFLAQEDTAHGLDPLASEDTSRQKAIATKEQWKELKATYQEHVEAITSALPKMQEAQRKRAQLQDALEQLQAKKQAAMEKRRTAQKQWQLQQEKRLRHLAEVSAEVRERQTGTKQAFERLCQELAALKQQTGQEQDKLQRHQTFLQLLYTLQGELLSSEAEAELPQEQALPEDKPQQLTRPQEPNTGDFIGASKTCSPQPAVDASMPWLPGGQQHKEGS